MYGVDCPTQPLGNLRRRDRLVRVAHFQYLPGPRRQLLQTIRQGRPAFLPDIILMAGTGSQDFEQFVVKQLRPPLALAVVLEDFVPSDPPSPGKEVAPLPKLAGISGHGQKDFLKHVIGCLTLCHQTQDEPAKRSCVLQEQFLDGFDG